MLKDAEGRTIDLFGGEDRCTSRMGIGHEGTDHLGHATDRLLIDFADSYGRIWKAVSQQLDDFIEGECKNR
jgi:hypothetical protein